MDNFFVLIITFVLCFGFALMYAGMVYWMDRYEKEPTWLLLGVFIWGAVVATGAAYVFNTIFGVGIFYLSGSEDVTNLVTASIVAPLVEETLKGLAVLIVFLLFRKEFDSVMDGIVYASITALGFAATENVLYLYNNGFQEDGWEGLWFLFFLRIIFGAWNHPFFTSFTGIGLAIARLNRSTPIRLIVPVLFWMAGTVAHALHNLVASLASGLGGLAALFFIDWLGWFFMMIVVLWALSREQVWIKKELKGEVTRGLITAAQYKIATSAWLRSFDRIRALFSGRYRVTNKFYHAATELAFTKHQYRRVGESHGNSLEMVEKLRKEVHLLSPKVKV